MGNPDVVDALPIVKTEPVVPVIAQELPVKVEASTPTTAIPPNTSHTAIQAELSASLVHGSTEPKQRVGVKSTDKVSNELKERLRRSLVNEARKRTGAIVVARRSEPSVRSLEEIEKDLKQAEAEAADIAHKIQVEKALYEEKLMQLVGKNRKKSDTIVAYKDRISPKIRALDTPLLLGPPEYEEEESTNEEEEESKDQTPGELMDQKAIELVRSFNQMSKTIPLYYKNGELSGDRLIIDITEGRKIAI